MRVLVACEFSGRVRDAFLAKGHDAWSCDLLPTEVEGPHYQCDVRTVLNQGWDLMICHPPCTYLAVSGARWWKKRQREQVEALDFVRLLLAANIPRICLENPKSVISSKIRRPNQCIEPWMFGEPEAKLTCLWLKNLPPLKATNRLTLPASGLWSNQIETSVGSKQNVVGGKDRAKERSRTYKGIAEAMANQWGVL